MDRAKKSAIAMATLFALVAAMISSSRAIGQRINRFVSPEDTNWDLVDISSASNAAVPTVSCPPCSPPEVIGPYFDNVIPPALPSGCTATNADGPPPLWVTSDSGVPAHPADTLPNAAFIDDPDVVSDKRLDFQFFTDFQQVSFRHNFNLEASDLDDGLGFDGAVLELSTDGGNTFQDILD